MSSSILSIFPLIVEHAYVCWKLLRGGPWDEVYMCISNRSVSFIWFTHHTGKMAHSRLLLTYRILICCIFCTERMVIVICVCVVIIVVIVVLGLLGRYYIKTLARFTRLLHRIT